MRVKILFDQDHRSEIDIDPVKSIHVAIDPLKSIDVAVPLVTPPDPDQLTIALSRAAAIVSSLETDAKASSVTLHDIQRQHEQYVALNTLAKSNTSEGTALINNFNARFKALSSEQKTAKLVSDLCTGTQLEALVKRYFDASLQLSTRTKIRNELRRLLFGWEGF